ncbi:helix-turn-helix domain-containing protein [Lutispora thermophila]|uniref:Transcriptional regulator, contains XRE-family HTH domain n=1 Tax=Lutispora thermophila DSM 19022 TaxID=1122184 RepID=A0A1M6DCW0_9FIRM|nr:helix-turn-helix domain-containing protein [Lutispora thermophila]SHI71042.1 Transcriptional regulator, contains XRE-family HTH domain [Lutispora thermophila DSM 19022]
MLEIENVGKRIITRLTELNQKQADLCRVTGLSNNAVSQYVTGKRTPDTLSLYKIATALDVPMEWILTGENKYRKIDTTNEKAESLTEQEKEMLWKFRQLDARDQEYAKANIDMLYDKALKKGTLSGSMIGGTGEEAAASETA